MRNLRRALALLVVSASTTATASPQHWVERNGWGFDNFDTASLSWDIYRDAFIGVPPTRSLAGSLFDALFYDNLFETELSKDGNCYGMSLLSMYLWKNEGHQGFCAPASQYSTANVASATAPLTRLVNTLHGHQVNLPTLRLFLDLVVTANSRDGNYAYGQVGYYQSLDDPTIVSITESLNPADGGHSMVAYDARVHSGSKRIFVYDPNRPWFLDQAWYQADSNVITIDSSGNWDFTMASGNVWSGGPSSGGHITITPLSVTGPPSRLPTTLGLNALGLINTIFVSGAGGTLEQVVDADGKRLYVPGTMEIDTDPSTGMLKLVPWFPSDGRGQDRQLGAYYFFLSPPGSSVDVGVASGPAGYELRFVGHHGVVRVTGRGSAPRDTIRVVRGEAGIPDLLLRNATGFSEYEVEFRELVGSQRVRVVRLSQMRVPRGTSALLRLARDSEELSVTSTGEAIEYRVDLEAQSPWGLDRLEGRTLRAEPGRTQVLRPGGWTELSKEQLQIREALEEPRRKQ